MAIISEKDNITQGAANVEFQIEQATQTLERNIGFITTCDNKASVVLTAIGVLLTLIFTNDGLETINQILTSCIKEKTFCSALYLIVFIIVIVAFLFGLYNLIGVLVARTNMKANGTEKIDSQIFFLGIAKNANYNIYKDNFYKLSRQNFLDQLISEIYINAIIAERKYQKYNWGLRLSLVGFILFVSLILIGMYIYWGGLSYGVLWL